MYAILCYKFTLQRKIYFVIVQSYSKIRRIYYSSKHSINNGVNLTSPSTGSSSCPTSFVHSTAVLDSLRAVVAATVPALPPSLFQAPSCASKPRATVESAVVRFVDTNHYK